MRSIQSIGQRVQLKKESLFSFATGQWLPYVKAISNLIACLTFDSILLVIQTNESSTAVPASVLVKFCLSKSERLTILVETMLYINICSWFYASNKEYKIKWEARVITWQIGFSGFTEGFQAFKKKKKS